MYVDGVFTGLLIFIIFGLLCLCTDNELSLISGLIAIIGFMVFVLSGVTETY